MLRPDIRETDGYKRVRVTLSIAQKPLDAYDFLMRAAFARRDFVHVTLQQIAESFVRYSAVFSRDYIGFHMRGPRLSLRLGPERFGFIHAG